MATGWKSLPQMRLVTTNTPQPIWGTTALSCMVQGVTIYAQSSNIAPIRLLGPDGNGVGLPIEPGKYFNNIMHDSVNPIDLSKCYIKGTQNDLIDIILLTRI